MRYTRPVTLLANAEQASRQGGCRAVFPYAGVRRRGLFLFGGLGFVLTRTGKRLFCRIAVHRRAWPAVLEVSRQLVDSLLGQACILNTRVPAILSCRPCFFSVKATIMYPAYRRRPESIFDQYRPLALPKLIRFPDSSVTLSPSNFFPKVACHEDDSEIVK